MALWLLVNYLYCGYLMFKEANYFAAEKVIHLPNIQTCMQYR